MRTRQDRGEGPARLDGVPTGAVGRLRETFDGRLVGPDDPVYDDLRRVWNPMVDGRPSLLACPAGTADVVALVRFAREHGLDLAVRAGGHNPAGASMPDGAVVLDMRSMRGVRVDPGRRHAWVQGGCLLGDADRETTPYGLAVPSGVVWHTGVAGLALGGGYGWLSRRYGLTADHLAAAEVVTAEGTVVQVDDQADAELMWGLRGGGGNWGVVTGFGFRLELVPDVVHTLDLQLDVRDAPPVLAALADALPDVPRGVTTYLGVENAPPLDGLGEDRVGLPVVWWGAVALDGATTLSALGARLEGSGRVLARQESATAFRTLQRERSGPEESPERQYWKAYYVRDLDSGVRGVLADGAVDPDRPLAAAAEIVQQGGAIGDLSSEATAFAHRDAAFDVLFQASWSDPADDERHMAAAREWATRMAPHASGVYVNNLFDEGEERVRQAYGDARWDRLVTLKQRVDPDNVFRHTANIPPI